jgi:hypothetical protein
MDKSECEEVIRIGFLNDQVDRRLEAYKRVFDVVITNDGPMDFVLALIHSIEVGHDD